MQHSSFQNYQHENNKVTLAYNSCCTGPTHVLNNRNVSRIRLTVEVSETCVYRLPVKTGVSGLWRALYCGKSEVTNQRAVSGHLLAKSGKTYIDHEHIKRTGNSVGGRTPFIPMKAPQWCMKPVKPQEITQMLLLLPDHWTSTVCAPETSSLALH